MPVESIQIRGRVFAAAELEKPGEHFLVVGTAHMVGDRGVPALLRKRGFTIEER
jgi:uncharacterized protein YbaP (TraB family)